MMYYSYDMTSLILATAQFGRFRDTMGVPVITTVGKPRSGWSAAAIVNELAPFGIFNVKPALPQDVFTEKYMARLDAKKDVFLVKLADLQDRNPDQTLVLLCWCPITSDDHAAAHQAGFCHRRIAAAWFEATMGIVVPELTLATPANRKATTVTSAEDLTLGI